MKIVTRRVMGLREVLTYFMHWIKSDESRRRNRTLDPIRVGYSPACLKPRSPGVGAYLGKRGT